MKNSSYACIELYHAEILIAYYAFTKRTYAPERKRARPSNTPQPTGKSRPKNPQTTRPHKGLEGALEAIPINNKDRGKISTN